MQKKLIVFQESAKDCGACCLLSIIRYYNGNISLTKLIEMTNTTKKGTNFYNLKEASFKIGLSARALKIENNYINKISCPFICQIKKDNCTHFVVVYEIKNNNILIMDPVKGKVFLKIEELFKLWTGYIMIFEPNKKLTDWKEQKYLNKLIVNIFLDNKKVIINCFILSILFSVFSILYSCYLKVIVDKVIGQDISVLLIVTLIFLVIIVFRSLSNLFRNQLFNYVNFRIDVSLFLNVFKRVLLLPYNYYKNKTTGEVIARINDLSCVKNLISKIIITVLLDFILAMVSLIILYVISVKMFLLSVVIVLIYIIIIVIYSRLIKKKIEQSQEDMAYVNSYLVESIGGYETIKNLNIEENINEKFERLYIKAQRNVYDYNIIYNIVFFLKDIIGAIGVLLINYLGCIYILNNNFTIGDLLMFNTVLGYFLDPVRNIIDLIDECIYATNSLKRANGLYEVELEELSRQNELKINGDIVIKDLNFNILPNKMILNNINITIKDKERVLLLGESGSGKSTLMKILYKYYKLERNKIFINNVDINDYSLKDIRSDIVYVSQNEILYTDSIKNNIMCCKNIKYVDFLKICDLTKVANIIEKNILGYDLLLEENGVNISGGEAQRIILARALLKSSKIILIDEGLSQMDINLERQILKNIFNYFSDKTFVIVSHRTENMDLYDKVLELKNGIVNDCLVRKKV